jgi:hypothetical protein
MYAFNDNLDGLFIAMLLVCTYQHISSGISQEDEGGPNGRELKCYLAEQEVRRRQLGPKVESSAHVCSAS